MHAQAFMHWLPYLLDAYVSSAVLPRWKLLGVLYLHHCIGSFWHRRSCTALSPITEHGKVCGAVPPLPSAIGGTALQACQRRVISMTVLIMLV